MIQKVRKIKTSPDPNLQIRRRAHYDGVGAPDLKILVRFNATYSSHKSISIWNGISIIDIRC